MAFNYNMLSSDNFGFDFGDGNRNGSMHDSNFLAFDIHSLQSPYLSDTSPFQLYGNAAGSYRTTLNRMNTILTRQHQVMFGADVQQQNMSYFTTTTTTAVEHPPVTATATLPHGGQFGVVVQRSVVETVTYRPITPQPQPLSRVSCTSPNYYHPKNCMPTEIKADDVDDHDIKPRILHLPPNLPQNNNNNNNNNNNSTYSLRIEGKNKIKMSEQDDDKDDIGHKNRTDEYKTRSLKHKKYGPYTCPRCERKIATSQSFASHMRSHYSSETEEERKMRMEAKYKKKNLRVSISGDGLTLLPQEMD